MSTAIAPLKSVPPLHPAPDPAAQPPPAAISDTPSSRRRSGNIEIGLVEEDLPPVVKRQSSAERIAALIDQIEPGRWYRVAVFSIKSSCSNVRKQLKDRGITDVEWTTRELADGRIGLWGRRQ